MKRDPLPFDYLPPVSLPHPEPTIAERLILGDELHFGDDHPQWWEGRRKRPCQTAAEAAVERLRLVQRLRRYSARVDFNARAVADRLERCCPDFRCRSGACPECARAWQRWFTVATQDFLAHATPTGSQGMILSPVHETGIVEPGEGLPPAALRSVKSVVHDALTAAGLTTAVVGIDVSFNEHLTADFRPHWCLHPRVFVPGALTASAVRTLRTHFPPSELIPRPLKVAAFDGNPAGIAYGMKPAFGRRQSYEQTKPTATGTRQCRNTRGRPLRGDEAVELAIFLDAVGLRQRLILHEAALKRDQGGAVVIRLDHRLPKHAPLLSR
ncbi:hypothetical protein [Methylorubrum extorquens]|uniref:hypothetical protein n=1 Tax=Methylorubrum extorquens TaxID=408 RepID=UPI000158FAAF|nr:hypothetical protein [Methylorubrum extorquens]ABY28680.1 hypothetical protein Mext_0256 [Methylorubrum extorquens PA1]KQP85770.1 hypothetical protein ASF55_15625 [Methylobacterium sp. Leaf119]WIU40060.1 hypothetical protein KQ926_01380 [Methylorubrum extorquens]